MAQNLNVAVSAGYHHFVPSEAAAQEYRAICFDPAKHRNAFDYLGSYAEDLPLLEERLPSVTVPVLITWGAQDPFVLPSNAQRLHALLPNSELTVFDDAGHFSHEDADESWLARVTHVRSESLRRPGGRWAFGCQSLSAATATRDRLIEGMRVSLRARGYGSTSMKDLLASTGVSSGSMYHSFPGGKEELAAATIREVGLRGAELIRNVFANSAGVSEGLALIFGSLMSDLEQSDFSNGCPIGVPAAEAVGVSSQIQEACHEVFFAWVEAYRDALVGEGWTAKEATAMATVIVTAYEGSLTIARVIRSTTPIADASAHLAARVRAP